MNFYINFFISKNKKIDMIKYKIIMYLFNEKNFLDRIF